MLVKFPVCIYNFFKVCVYVCATVSQRVVSASCVLDRNNWLLALSNANYCTVMGIGYMTPQIPFWAESLIL